MQILTFTGEELDAVLREIQSIYRSNDNGILHTLRFAIDGGKLMVKENEYMWSAPITPSQFDSGLAG